MPLFVSDDVKAKLGDKHQVTLTEVHECFANRERTTLVDNREQHRTTPPTQWFIAETFMGRELKICFMVIDGTVHLKSAFPPIEVERNIYQRYSKPRT